MGAGTISPPSRNAPVGVPTSFDFFSPGFAVAAATFSLCFISGVTRARVTVGGRAGVVGFTCFLVTVATGDDDVIVWARVNDVINRACDDAIA